MSADNTSSPSGAVPSTRRLATTDLRLGMYVSRLDRDWLDTPFIMQGFHIESVDDITVVGEHCEYVWVDDTKTLKQYQKEQEDKPSKSQITPTADPNVFAPEVPIGEEHSRMLGTFKSARSITKTLLDDFQLGGVVNTDAAKGIVDDCVDSVLRHPDALLWMTKMRDQNEYTAEHCLNVCILSIAVGRQLGMSTEDLRKLGMSGLLHDVGKMKIPTEILDKPGPLTIQEMRIMATHTVHGRNLLMSSSGLFESVVDVAYCHHERIDGRGYPRNLKGGSLSIFTKIVAIVDAYDAMTADRCYQMAKTTVEAMRIIYKEKGTHFDEQLTLKFLKIIGLYPAGSIVELHSGEVGMVVEGNSRYRHLPKVMMMRDEDKNPLEETYILDLSLVEKGKLSSESLIKKVWKDNSFGISISDFDSINLFQNL